MDRTISQVGTRSREGALSSPDLGTVLISANAFWNIVNFRGGLINALARRNYRLIVASPQPDHNWARKNAIRAETIDIDRSGLNPFSDARLFLEYFRLFKASAPRFYLGFTAKPNIYGSVAARILGVTAIPNVSGLGTAFLSNGPLSWLVGHLYRIAFQKCPIVFFQNPDDRDLFVRRKIVRPEQARLIPGSGVDLKQFAPPDREPAGFSFLFVGRLLGDKGVREFVEAANRLRAEQPSWRFQLLGPIDAGNRTSIRRAELDRWIDDGVIEYLGETDDVRPFVAASSAVVLPSYREGLPRTLLEAAAMARPLVATDVPGNRQIVQNGVTGLLCLPRDAQSLAEAMSTMGMMPPEERHDMGQAGRRLVQNCYAEERVVSAYLNAMAQLEQIGGV
jgi:glycosyltransferase involved in cell wall biosynthesis